MYLDLYKNIQDAGCQNRYMELSSLRCCSTHTHTEKDESQNFLKVSSKMVVIFHIYIVIYIYNPLIFI